MDDTREFLCPRCARPLVPVGRMFLPDAPAAPLPVLHCEFCVVQTELYGLPCAVHPTYYVDEDGRLATRGVLVDPQDN